MCKMTRKDMIRALIDGYTLINDNGDTVYYDETYVYPFRLQAVGVKHTTDFIFHYSKEKQGWQINRNCDLRPYGDEEMKCIRYGYITPRDDTKSHCYVI